MRMVEVLRMLGEVTASQWGMVTTAQAASLGVSRLALARAAEAGHLIRLTQGVYREAGAPVDEFEDLRAGWLATDPTRTAEDRLSDGSAGVVVSGVSAAWLHKMGDLLPEPYQFTTPTRRQSQRAGIHFRIRHLHDNEVTLVAGLPVTTAERTLADMVADRIDLSLVADALADATRAGGVNLQWLADLLGPVAARHGHARGDGKALLDHLLSIVGLDSESVAARMASTEIGPLVTARYLRNLLAHHPGNGPTLNPELAHTVRQLQEQLTSSLQPLQQTMSALEQQTAPHLLALGEVLRTNTSLSQLNAVNMTAVRTALEPFTNPAWQQTAARLRSSLNHSGGSHQATALTQDSPPAEEEASSS
ncbi:type IV toxin-antitoxin system AbiEi family antitoxin domain-containing protein [Kocuria rosea]|uniref:type IV toxin-antitoxin system AbiEi family antitoxin domain-containing protein n=1 Tax=Kocuria rosea TaxID=1275 RepID=UPI001386A4DA|nr:type IV toxin-antitoxin system AbiEi family antitoxin domain-containing protein [Kocuria rosea]